MQVISEFREMCDSRDIQTLSQGSVFNFAYHEEYKKEEILGIVITARCDIANSKAKKYSYLPAIPISIWFDKEIPGFLEKRLLRNKEESLKKSLISLGFTINAVKMYGGMEVLEKIRVSKPNKYKDVQNKLIDYNKILSIKENFIVDKNFYLSNYDKEIRSIMKDLIENKMMDYFFIDSIGEYGACIINLREINHLDRIVAEKITIGIEPSKIDKENKSDYRSINFIDDESLIMLIGKITSPYIELILQRFSDIYTRIGIENPSKEIVNTILNKIKVC